MLTKILPYSHKASVCLLIGQHLDCVIIKFLKAEYTVQIKDGLNEKEEHWVIYFMEEEGIYSAYAVLANENFDFVKSYSEGIVKSYQNKQ